MVSKTPAPKFCFVQAEILNHGPHCAVDHQDAVFEQGANFLGAIGLAECIHRPGSAAAQIGSFAQEARRSRFHMSVS